MHRNLLCALACIAWAACTPSTQFQGSAKFPDGVAGCRRACSAEGLEMGAYVMSGEFATSCVCRAPGSAPTASADPSVGAAIWTLGMAARYSGPIEMQEERRHERLTPH